MAPCVCDSENNIIQLFKNGRLKNFSLDSQFENFIIRYCSMTFNGNNMRTS